MNPIRLAIKNLLHRPLNSLFNLLLIILSSGMISLGLLVNTQFEDHFSKNLGPSDLILTAKGSPLQAVLCNLFHIDFPTGNISLQEVKAFLREGHPVIQLAIPIALGDQYAGFRILGTTQGYFAAHQLQLREGSLFKDDFQVVIGADVAQNGKLKLGDRFTSGHGINVDESLAHEHDHHEFQVVGILNPSGTVNDRLVLSTISSYWQLHHDAHAEDHSEHYHGPACITNHDLINAQGEITSLLLTFKGTNIQSLNFGRNINENTQLMAVNPAIELNRLYELTGTASQMLAWVVSALVLMTMFSLFISLWQAMEDRTYEMALLRFAGASSTQVIGWTVLESVILCMLGVVIGISLAHVGLILFEPGLKLNAKYGIRGDILLHSEWMMLGISFIFAVAAGIIPSLKAMKADIHHLLSSE